ncbi:MAG TPA: S8 family serine peptidase [Solirubrobacteraceae bacterium]|jgi:serine protease|nr:S8 family serine peptidase [Solirubrobacteraceae bacterium]
MTVRRHAIALLAALVAAALLPAAPASAARIVPGEVVVKRAGQPATVERVADVRAALRRLRAAPGVRYAAPNPVARAAATAFIPNDPGRGRGWQAVQWNFLPEQGVNAPVAWQHAIDAGVPGGRGVTIAVLDSGVAYADRGRFRQSPDFTQTRFVQGHDFVERDAYPNDENGHGTHVASTIAESTNNGIGLTGLAYGASIMPVRVLDERGEGDAATIADAVRFAVRRGADVINLSLEFGTDVMAREIPSLLDALAYARKRGVLVVGAAGNEGDRMIAFPARSTYVLSVGATTEHGCLSDYSNLGRGLDVVAPGGGTDAVEHDPTCPASATPGRSILQLTFDGGSVRRFGLPATYEGTSMAAPHVTATAALVLATRVLGAKPSPERLISHLKATARDLGPPGADTRYGAGLVDAATATDRRSPSALRLRRR